MTFYELRKFTLSWSARQEVCCINNRWDTRICKTTNDQKFHFVRKLWTKSCSCAGVIG